MLKLKIKLFPILMIISVLAFLSSVYGSNQKESTKENNINKNRENYIHTSFKDILEIYQEIQLPTDEKILEETEEVKPYTEEELYWLAKIVYAEAGYDINEGQQAVANVVINRVNHPNFPNNIYDVIWQKTGKIWQFSPCGDGGINKEPDERAIENARLILEGKRVLPEDVLFFYMPTEGNKNDWIRTREIYKTIGVHRFCY